ncbi:hypothetical protein FGO68_gene15426 [Halteria grandinella]|uniref:RAP domain-containing protein n=1 Tax=Halteria grandinella TaxID=5974 RepID=A0A8J8NBR3_HALGN|nr:hypothetical protein FGO68_gene15426 [Halteria grandinella]
MNILPYLSMLGIDKPDQFAEVYNQTIEKLEHVDVKSLNFNPLVVFKSLLYFSKLHPEFIAPKVELVFSKIRDYYLDFRQANPPKIKNALQTEIYKQLREKFPDRNFQEETTIDEWDLIFTDIVDKENKIVIEVDGQHHFLFNDESKRTGIDRFQERLIELYGYKVRRISVEKYNKLTEEEKAKLLTEIIQIK